MSDVGPVIFPFTGSGVGGSHVSTFLLAGALARDHGVETVVAAPDGSGIAAEAEARGLAVLRMPEPPARRRETLRDLLRLAARRRTLKAYGAGAILHCCDVWSLQSWGPAARSLGLPVVYHHRDFVTRRRRDRWPLKLAARIVSISEACTDNLGPDEAGRVVRIVNPFEAVAERAAFEAERALHQDRWPVEGLKLVGFSGNFLRRKRAAFFVEAASALAAIRPEARFLVFGRDREETAAELSALADRLGLGDRILFAGFRSPPERNLAPLDVLAAPALGEPFGRTLLEAAMLGVPYVATDDAGHGEIARGWGGGRLAPVAASPQAFAEALAGVLDAPAAVALDGPARAALAEALSPKSHAAKVLAVYRGLREN